MIETIHDSSPPPIESRRTSRGAALLENEPRILPELFLQSVLNHDLDDALNYKSKDEWHSVSSKEMIGIIEEIAFGLISIGLSKGDKAAILATNSPEWTFADAGCQFAGVIDVPIYTTLAPNSVQYILNDSGSKIIFLENRDAYDRIADQLVDCAAVTRLIFFDADGVNMPNAISSMTCAKTGERCAHSDLHCLRRCEVQSHPRILRLLFTLAEPPANQRA
jgi:long-subunit acyl-CoA synthetase (AMP-forming)